MFKGVLLAVAAMMFTMSATAADYIAGKHYTVIESAVATRDPSKVEVVEAFWYGCPHCFKLEPTIKPWIAALPEHVDFQHVPAQFGAAWKAHARAYYIAKLFKITEKFHNQMFVALHVDRKRLVSQDDQREFFVGLGVEANAFDKAYNSFSINSQLRQGNNKIISYGIQGVPALIINGKYIVNAGSAGGNAAMLKVADFLIAKEKK